MNATAHSSDSLSADTLQPQLTELTADSLLPLDSASLPEPFVFTEDDPILEMIDAMIISEGQLNSCFETDTAILNTYGYCPDFVPMFPSSVYEERLEKLNEQTPFTLSYNKVVGKFIELYAIKRRDQVSRMMGLSELYFPMFIELLDEHGMPMELKYLAVIESALNPSARSRSAAKGLWQFMYRTGKLYGLEVTSYIDERCDPYQSTVAACKYLSYLYGLYDDWNLALAAYNSGPGRVNRAIRRSGGERDYWKLWRYLPRETRGYVPAFIAVNYIMEYATEHNIYPVAPKYFDFQTDTIVIHQRVDFYQISAILDISVEDLEYLNPVYKKGIVPGISGESYVLTLPINLVGDFINNEQGIYDYGKLPIADSSEHLILTEAQRKIPKETQITHIVKRGEVLGLIAEKYKVGLSEIKDWNNLRSSRINIGQKLTIYTKAPKQIETVKTASAKAVKPQTSESSGYRYHTVQTGDTLWDIAKLYEGVTISQLRKLNQISNDRKLKPGMKIKISPISS